MRVFITGASGHIGSAVIPQLLEAGHEVTGLARSDKSADALAAIGVEVRRGDLDDLDGLRKAAEAADGVIHLAFKHEALLTGNYLDAVTADQRAIEAMGEALKGSGKPFVGTSGTLLLGTPSPTPAPGGLKQAGLETDPFEPGGRADAEDMVIGLAGSGVRTSVVRLPPTVHSNLDHHGFIPVLIGIARAAGVAGYVGDGSNRWPAGHTLDAAHLYRLALETAPAGSRLHAVGDEGIPFRQIAEAIGRQLGVPAASVDPDDAASHFGFLGSLVTIDNPTSSALTQELLGWKPTHPGLIEDLEEGHYFGWPVPTQRNG